MPNCPTILLSGFADETSSSKRIEDQLNVMAALGLSHVTLRFLDAGDGIRNLIDVSPWELAVVQGALHERGLAVASVGSPLGKVKLVDQADGTTNRYRPFEEYLQDEVARTIRVAQELGTRLIRAFSFYPPRGMDVGPFIPLAAERLRAIAERCDEAGLTLGLEVEANLIGHCATALGELLERIDHPAVMLIFDGANLVTQGYSEEEIWKQWRAMLPSIGWLHIKDYRPANSGGTNPSGNSGVKSPTKNWVDEEALTQYVPVGWGTSGYPAILADLRQEMPKISQRLAQRQIEHLVLDLEPHLQQGGQFGGYSGPAGMGVACRELCGMLSRLEIAYRLCEWSDLQQAY